MRGWGGVFLAIVLVRILAWGVLAVLVLVGGGR